MEKIPTLFIRNPENMKLVTRDINPDAAWVFTANVVPTIKKDGTNIRVNVVLGGVASVEKRRNPTREEKTLGAEPSYVMANRDDPSDKHIFAAVDATNFSTWPEGMWPCEALGPKIQGGIESNTPCLYPFSFNPEVLRHIDITYDAIKAFLETHEIEGIVWQDVHHYRAVKIKRRDFDLPWPPRKR